MLFRKGGTASSILAIALLVATIASMSSIVNYINSQTEALEGLPNIGGTYFILSRNSTSITDSRIDGELANRLSNTADVKSVLSQRILIANMTTKLGNRTIRIRAVEDVNRFLKLRGAHVNGTTAKGRTEANVGEILARTATISLEDEVNLTMGSNVLEVRVAGVFRTQTEIDAETVISMEASYQLTEDDVEICLMEFYLKENVNGEEALNRITQQLPKDVRIVKAQQPNEFIEEMNSQTLTFLDLWSLAIYAVVAAASYVVATSLIAESRHEFAMLKALGAKKRYLFTLVLTYAAATALLGLILGIGLGIAGAQTASTILRWVWPNVKITTFLEVGQALKTILLTLAASILGCVYPASRSACVEWIEQTS